MNETLPEEALETLRRALEDIRSSGGSTTRLLLIRHGENEPRGSGSDFQGDPSLSERGREQARRLAVRLSSDGLDGLYASPLNRTLETARILGDRLDRSPRTLEAVREIGHAPPDGEARPDRFARTGRWDELAGFESDEALRGRVREAADRILGRHAGQRVAVITHMMPLNALLADRLGARRSFFFRPHPASVTELYLDGERCFLGRLNDVSHLADGGDDQ